MTKAREHFESAFECLVRGDRIAALFQLQAGLLIDPADAASWANRGKLLNDMGHPFEAMISFDRAISLNQNQAGFHNDLATALVTMHRPREALACYDRALALVPEAGIVLANKGALLGMLGDIDGSLLHYRKAVAVHPEYPDFHSGLGMTLLRDGQLKEGWSEFGWSRDEVAQARRGVTHKEWRGEPLEGKTLVLYNDQGHGDAIQFMRYAPIVKRLYGGTVYVEVRDSMERLAATLEGHDGVLVFGGEKPEKVDYCAPMMQMPAYCGTDAIADIPSGCPYLSVDETSVDRWRRHLDGLLPPHRVKVGLCWAGEHREQNRDAALIDDRRSTKLLQYEPLAHVPDVAWVSLQKGTAVSQVHNPPKGMTIGAWPDEMTDFYETAALVECLDLVVTVDTAVAHLAAALGKPTWMLSRFDGCWRWMCDRADSPWYPTMRIFRQKSWGDWRSALGAAERALAEFSRKRMAA